MTNHNIVRPHEPLKNTYKRENLEKISKKNPPDVCRNHRPHLNLEELLTFSFIKT